MISVLWDSGDYWPFLIVGDTKRKICHTSYETQIYTSGFLCNKNKQNRCNNTFSINISNIFMGYTISEILIHNSAHAIYSFDKYLCKEINEKW